MKIEDVIERETGQTVDSATLLQDLPVDSLEYLDLILTVEREMGKNLPDGRLATLTTVGELIQELS
jgi:acyl carrier protein